VKALFAAAAALATVFAGLVLLAVVLAAGRAGAACSAPAGATPAGPASAGPPPTGSWTATAYGPPWGGIQGDGVTATGLDLSAGPPALEIAVDPRVIRLGSWVYVQPNPFGTRSPFYAGDTGGAILGRHIDIYDWRGRSDQDAWGTRAVTVTLAAGPGAGAGAGAGSAGLCAAGLDQGALALTPGETARVLADGSAAAPALAPGAVRRVIAAGNLIHTLPYPEPDAHYGTLARIWPAYDCSGATSLLLYAAGLLGAGALDSTGLESYGQPGPGHWISVYANSTHAWIVVAGIALNTADYGGPSIPAGSGPRWRAEPLANLNDGSRYVVRHPAGL
jgi:3D (Asp-Asp-Asp) domain-containing protein